jgi:acetolactate synthase-1/2/3 large subunit
MSVRTADLRSGGQILVDQLLIHGANLAFCVPGESYLPVLDALFDVSSRLRLITCRHEANAANMAEAYGKLTGTPGICFVTRGPGATHAAIAVHTAFQDSTPMILFIGQVGGDFIEREAFQEIDYRRMFGSLTKWVAQIDRAERIPEFIARAYQTATSGRMGPVVLALPEDMLFSKAVAEDARPWQRVETAPPASEMERFSQLLRDARRPIVIVGGSGWTSAAYEDLRRFIEIQAVPVACAFRFQHLFDNMHPSYAGDVGVGVNPELAARIRAADLIVCIGARLGEMTTSGYELLRAPVPAQKLIHIHAGAEELGRVFQADLMINATMPAAAQRLASLRRLTPPGSETAAQEAHAALAAWRGRREIPGKVQLWDVFEHLNSVLPADAIVTNGAGNYAGWANRFYRYRQFRTQVAPTSGAMGYGVPAALAAKALHPDRTVVCLAGGSIPAERRLHRRQQQHVRHYPHASGARVSRQSARHHARQSRLRGVCEIVWRARRDSRGHQRVRACPGARAEGQPTRAHRVAHRPRGHHAEHHAQHDSLAGTAAMNEETAAR